MLNPIKLFEAVPRQGPILLAVSGGSDSLALLLLANAWSLETNIDLQVVTVDHGLRPEAAAEAAFVAGTCEGLDIPHVTLAWEGLKPNSGLSEAARNARYQLLEEFALEIGATAILTAHTADDQAETVYMRLQRETPLISGLGLSGMAPSTRLSKGPKLLRPLLGTTRDALRSYLHQHTQSWIEDPSNFDPAYERVRVRNRISDNPTLKSRLLDFSAVCGRIRGIVARDAAEFLENHARLMPGLVFSINTKEFKNLPAPVKYRVLQVLVAVNGGGQRFPSNHKLKPVIDWLADEKILTGHKRMTIGRAIIAQGRDNFSVFRENRNLNPSLLDSGNQTIWDNRFEVTNDTSRNFYVGPLDKELLDELEAVHNKRFAITPRAALLSLPVLRFDDGETVVPFIKLGKMPKGIEITAVCQPLEYFSPGFDEPISSWFRKYKHSLAKLLPAQY